MGWRSEAIGIKKMIFRIELRRSGKKIAQGATLGMGKKRIEALKGRQSVSSFLSPFQGLRRKFPLTQGCTLGYCIPLRWSAVRKLFFLIAIDRCLQPLSPSPYSS